MTMTSNEWNSTTTTIILMVVLFLLGLYLGFTIKIQNTEAQTLISRYNFAESGTPTITTVRDNLNYMMNYNKAQLNIIDEKLNLIIREHTK